MRIACRGVRAPRVDSGARLRLETLDGRDVPSATFGCEEVPLGPGIIGMPANVPPRIVNFSAVCLQGGGWEFSGDVVDETHAGLTVTLGGEPGSLQGITVVTDVNGHFEKVIILRTDGTDNGFASAQTADNQGMSSNIATCYVMAG
jgi:hypothetical protein